VRKVTAYGGGRRPWWKGVARRSQAGDWSEVGYVARGERRRDIEGGGDWMAWAITVYIHERQNQRWQPISYVLRNSRDSTRGEKILTLLKCSPLY
jgi:hypothetical protein